MYGLLQTLISTVLVLCHIVYGLQIVSGVTRIAVRAS
jgi:hypothetical protein